MKNLIFKLIVVCALVIAATEFTSRFFPLFRQKEDCAFCDPQVIKAQKFYEDDLVLGLCTHKPIVPGHCLIIPKRHVERFEMLTDEEILHMSHLIKRIHRAVSSTFGTTGYLLLQKNGREAGQSVPHVHFHYIPKQSNDWSSLAFLGRFYLANFKNPLSPEEMKPTVQRIQEALALDKEIFLLPKTEDGKLK